MDTNREAGTVSTGDYGRGDSAALFVAPKALLGGSSLGDKAAMEGVVRKALSQKVRGNARARPHGAVRASFAASRQSRVSWSARMKTVSSSVDGSGRCTAEPSGPDAGEPTRLGRGPSLCMRLRWDHDAGWLLRLPSSISAAMGSPHPTALPHRPPPVTLTKYGWLGPLEASEGTVNVPSLSEGCSSPGAPRSVPSVPSLSPRAPIRVVRRVCLLRPPGVGSRAGRQPVPEPEAQERQRRFHRVSTYRRCVDALLAM